MRAKAELISDVDRPRTAERPDPIPVPVPKLVFDKVAAVLGLILLAPVFGSIALAIRVHGGPRRRGLSVSIDLVTLGRRTKIQTFVWPV